MAQTTALVGGTVIDGTSTPAILSAVVLVGGDRLVCVGTASQCPRALRADPARWYRSYLCSGITAVYDAGGPPWTTTHPPQAEGDSMALHFRAAAPRSTSRAAS